MKIMRESTGTIRSIAELLKENFFIPAYQRGYRWEKIQVEELLEDLYSFKAKEVQGTDEKTWYCLQPLVIKEIQKDHDSLSFFRSGEKAYELIDGQQRITTFFLIGHYINEMWRGKSKDREITIRYQSRKKSENFLEGLCLDENDKIEVDQSNIDFYHISTAYQTIADWVKKQDDFKQDQFVNTFLHNAKVIWYETFSDDPIQIFTRINMGKIPLTNAELIKALFLNCSNFLSKDEEKLRLKQFEIAHEWDRMESALHNPEFWYFLNEKENQMETRIDFLFSILTNDVEVDDPYSIFRCYYSKFKKHTVREIEKNWEEAKRCFQILEEWYTDRTLYHLIGYLISCGARLRDLIDLAKKSKQDFLRELKIMIAALLPDDLDGLSYKDSKVRRVLLLHNIQTMLNNVEESSRFPFNRFKTCNWDVEHIHSVHEKKPENDKHQKDWLKDTRSYIDESESLLIEDIDACLNSDNWQSKIFNDLYLRSLSSLSKGESSPDINDLGNLALLDSKTNRGYGNAVFPVKRETIIKHEKKGTFVPICTKNIFMKFNSQTVNNFTFWCPEDRKDYFDDMTTTLQPFYELKVEGAK